MTLPSPAILLGSPSPTFLRWRKGQDALFSSVMDWYYSPARFVGLACPTGSGKSLLALLTARVSGDRTIIVTATKGLQEQYLHDLRPLGGVSVVGQNNFGCPLVPSLRADEGPCHDGVPCPFPADNACPYREQLKKAQSASLVVTNYAYFLAQTNYSSGIGEIGLLVLDEGHMAFAAMENYLTVYLSRLDIEPVGITFPKPTTDDTVTPWSVWRTWAETALPSAQETVDDMESRVKDYRSRGETVPGALARSFRTAKSVAARLDRIADVGDDWVIQQTRHGYRFVPKWVAKYSSQLFRDIPKVMLMSAILSHKTCDYLGVPSGESRSWLEAPSYFPAANTPIYHIPTARINHHIDDYGSTIWVSRIDQIIQRRLDRKGIVFTVSYERARMLLSQSRFKDIMFSHSTGDVVAVVEKFKKAPPPALLVSPAVTTGWDFPGGGEPQYIIVGKIPYPDTRDEVTATRYAEDKDWTSYLAMDTFVQESGRGSRSAEDRCEVLVVDDAFRWFYWKYKEFAPQWFRERVRGSLSSVPEVLI